MALDLLVGSKIHRALGPFGRLRVLSIASARPPRSYSLRISIALLFTALITALGAVLIIYSYERHRTLALDEAAQLFSEVARNSAASASALYSPVQALIEQTARLDAPDSTLDNLPLSFEYLTQSLDNNNQLDAFFLGFTNGDFFLVAKLSENIQSREAFGAPDNASFVARRIENTDLNQPIYTTSYFDANLELLSTNNDFVTGYDPRTRPWYREAINAQGTIVTKFYRFFTSGQIGTTLARKMSNGNVVIGADLRLETISSRLGSPALTDLAKIVLFTDSGDIIGYNDANWLKRLTGGAVRGELRSPLVSDIDVPEIGVLFDRFVAGERDGQMSIDAGRGRWFASVSPIEFGANEADQVYAAILTPEHELLAGQQAVRLQSVLLSLLALVVAVLFAWWMSYSISRSTEALAEEAKRIQRLQLDDPFTVRSRIIEIDRLAVTIATMKAALRRFVALTTETLGELDIDALGELAIKHIAPACGAASATVLLLSDDKQRMVRLRQKSSASEEISSTYPQANDYLSDVVEVPQNPTQDRQLCPDQHAAVYKQTVWIDDVSAAQSFNTQSYQSRSVLVVPLLARDGELIGVIHLGDIAPVSGKALPANTWMYAEALAAHAGLAFENQRLTEARRDSFEALIRMLAKAIDAKSPHTGKHCQRVPILSMLLAETASESSLPAFKDYSLNDAAREEFEVASWLHDCGKVTTPDHIVDKATKLEVVYNRIHEIRMRFEVLWRDVEIRYLRSRLKMPSTDAGAIKRRRNREHARLTREFAFVAQCNLGSNKMTKSDYERLQVLSKVSWIRHFDDKLGLSAGELARRSSTLDEQLPARESLLADKPYHRMARNSQTHVWGDNPHGFTMKVPVNEVNNGELYNLTIAQGTLNEEERFRINDHVVQTIQMLEAIPFPKELSQVPRIAGNHHERLDGTGYPRGLSAQQLGIEDRILAIADIFEALTAEDRPYRTALSIDEAIAIMRGMRDRGQICPDLFNLFVENGLHRLYSVLIDRQHVEGVNMRSIDERATANDDAQGVIHYDIG